MHSAKNDVVYELYLAHFVHLPYMTVRKLQQIGLLPAVRAATQMNQSALADCEHTHTAWDSRLQAQLDPFL